MAAGSLGTRANPPRKAEQKAGNGRVPKGITEQPDQCQSLPSLLLTSACVGKASRSYWGETKFCEVFVICRRRNVTGQTKTVSAVVWPACLDKWLCKLNASINKVLKQGVLI